MKFRSKTKVGLTGLGAAAVLLAVALPAHADYAPTTTDIVGVGGDTPQFDLAFGADGDTAGALGFNASGAYNRLVTFNATADGNARAAYKNGSTLASSLPLNPTDTLRAGTSPVQRVQSSGAAITALLADTSTPETINFIFSASEPTAAQQSTAVANGWGFLHVVQIAKDGVVIGASNTTDAPSTGLTIAQLLNIYTGTWTNWGQVPGATGTAAIVPLIPPSSSSITKTFLADLKTANGGVAPTLAASVKVVEQNDPTAITTTATPNDAIVPFSSARLSLYNSGYFHTPDTTFPGGAAIVSGVSALGGYNSEVDHYVIFRQSDYASTTPMEPGGTKNFVNTLFSNTASPTSVFFNKTTGKALITASGATPVYNDLGNVSSG